MDRIIELKKRMEVIFRDCMQEVSFFWFLLPLAVVLCAFFAISEQMPTDYSSWWSAHKQVLELWALRLIGGAFMVSLIKIATTKASVFSIWLSTLALILWFREIHWEWTSNGVYVGVFLWAVIGVWQYEKLKASLFSPRTLTLLGLIFFSYAVAVTFDQQWWTDTKYMDKVGKLAGEVLEDLGHLLVLVLMLFGPWASSREHLTRVA